MNTTHEQTERNAEIVQRRLAGEATGALALEYQVTPTRIAQLVRRHREKAGEILVTGRTKKPTRPVQPRLRKAELGLWLCAGGGVERRGETPKDAYDRWLKASLVNHVAAHFAPHASKPTEPEQPYLGPITVVPGMRPGNALKLPTALLLNGARAMAVQPRTPSLSGGRRGGE